MKIFKVLFTGIFVLFFLSLCTNNPFFSENGSTTDNLVIKGTVRLNNETNSSDIVVWLKGIDVYTRTDSLGKFSLLLPSPQSLPGGSAAWTGNYPVYFFMSNYAVDSITTFLKDGKVVNNREDIGKDGALKEEIVLKKIIDIVTTCDPDHITANLNTSVYLTISIHAYDEGQPFLTYIKSRNSREEGFDQLRAFFIYSLDGSLSKTKMILTEPSVFIQGYIYKPYSVEQAQHVNLEAGRYIIRPYFFIKQKNLPNEIYTLIGDNPELFTLENLKIPVKISGNILTVENL